MTELLSVAVSGASTMITTTVAGGILQDRAPLCPPPLHIQKKSRKATFRRRIFRKSTPTYSDDRYVCGPLDDIIDEIKSDIWDSPPDYSFDWSVLDWAHPLKAPLSWTVTPLPVSRTPSDYPLTIRKNRNSRSSASGSSFGDPMAYSRKNSQNEPENGGPVRSSHTATLTPWPLIDVAPNEPAQPSIVPAGAEHMSAQQALEKAISNTEDHTEPPKRRMSKLRLLTSGLPLLRRQNTGETSASASDTPDTSSPVAAAALAPHYETERPVVKHPDDEAVKAYLRRNAFKSVHTDTGLVQQPLRLSSAAKLTTLMEGMANRMPPPTDFDHDMSEAHVSDSNLLLPTTLRPAIRLFPQVKLLTDEFQEISVAIDIEGVLYNRKPLPNTEIDVIFVVDNGYVSP